MEFAKAAPGNLVVESGSYFGDWEAAATNYVMTQAEVETMVSGYLGDAAGWEQAGVTFRNVSGAPVVFQVVEEATCHVPEFACTHDFGDGSALVELEYSRIQAGFGRNLTNHESGHAFFTATHEGSGSVMTGDSPDGRPTASDIQSLEEWLSDTPTGGDDGDPNGTAAAGGALWFPADLDTYITKWPLSGAFEVRLYATVIQGAEGASLRAVWGNSDDGITGTRRHALTPALSVEEVGMFATDWTTLPVSIPADAYAGIVVKKTTTEVDLTDLVIGLAEVQIRG